MWRRFDEWWKRDACTVCNGFYFLAVAGWILLTVWVVGFWIGMILG